MTLQIPFEQSFVRTSGLTASWAQCGDADNLLVINAVMILLASKLVTGFRIEGFWTAFFFSLVLSFVNSLFNSLNSKKEEE